MPDVHPSRLDMYDLDILEKSNEEIELARLRELARRDVWSMARRMLYGKDRNRVARMMGIKRLTFDDKVRKGRFTAGEFLVLSYICGYEVEIKDKYQLMTDLVLEDADGNENG